MTEEKSKKTSKQSKQKWSIIEFYEKSWHLVWEHKKLWILGFAAMIFTAGGRGNFGIPNPGGPSDSSQEEVQEEMLQGFDFDSSVEDVLGVNIDEEYTASETPFLSQFKNIKDIFASIPAYIYSLLGLEISAFIIFSIVLSFAASGWAEAALMKGVSQAHEEDKVDLTTASKFATTKIKSLLWVKYIPIIRFIILTLLAILGSVIIFAILANSLGNWLAIFAILAFIIGVVIFVYLAIRLSFRVIYAKWHCIADDLSGSKSFISGMQTATGNLRKTFFLTIINGVISMLSIFFFAVPAIVFILLGILIVWFSGLVSSFSMLKAVFVSPIILSLILTMVAIFSIIGAILQVFFSSVWYLAFKAIKK